MLDGLTFDDKILLSELIAGTGVLPNLVALHRTARCPGNCSSPRAAAAASHLHVLQWLEAEGSCLCCVRVQQAVGSRAALEVLQWYAGREDAHPPTLFAAACDDDDPARRAAKLQHLHDKYGNEVITRRATAAAARRGDVATMAWLKERGGAIDAMTLVSAAGGGDVAAAAWALANGGAASVAAVHEAASEGRVAMMEWLAERRDLTVPPARWRRALAAAAGGGHEAAVRWLLAVPRAEAGQDALEAAAEGGHCEVMRLLLAHGSRPSAEALSLAAKSGSIPAMQLLMDAATAANAAAANAAAAKVSAAATTAEEAGAAEGGGSSGGGGGPVDILRPEAYMAASLSAAATSSAAAGGGGGGGGCCPARARTCLAALRWLEARGCPAGSAAEREEAMGAAALMGSRARMEWLRARGFGWSARTFAAAAASGCVRLVEWMAAQGCPMGRRGDALLAAGANSDAAMLAALRRLGCPWSADVLARAVRGALHLGAAVGGGGGGGGGGTGGVPVRCRWDVLRWMVDNGCPVTQQAYDVARRCGRDDVADWIKRSGKMR